MSVQIVQTRVLEDHAEYGVTCLENDSPGLIVWRRYREFEQLRHELAHLLDEVPYLPPKHSWWASRSSEVIQSRKTSLQLFLQRIHEQFGRKQRPAYAMKMFRQFVGIPQEQEENHYTSELAQFETERDRWMEERAGYREQIAGFQTEQQDTSQTIASTKKELQHLKAANLELETSLTNSKNLVSSLQSKLEQSVEKERAMKEEQSKLEKDLAVAQSSLEAEIKLSQLHQARASELEGKLGSLQDKYSQVVSKCDKSSQQATNLQRELDELQLVYSGCRTEKQELQNTVWRLEELSNQQDTRDGQLDHELELEKLTNKLQASEKSLAQANVVKLQMAARIEKLKAELEDAKS